MLMYTVGFLSGIVFVVLALMACYYFWADRE